MDCRASLRPIQPEMILPDEIEQRLGRRFWLDDEPSISYYGR